MKQCVILCCFVLSYVYFLLLYPPIISLHTTKSGAAVNVEEYVPVIVPINNANANHFMLSPPSNQSTNSIKIIAIELLMERDIVSVTAVLITSTYDKPILFLRSSRMRSYTTIVSCTEKDK